MADEHDDGEEVEMAARVQDPLQVAVQRLTTEHVEAERKPASTERHYARHEALIAQLRRAVGGNVTTGGAGGKLPSQRTPVDPDALDKYLALQQRVLAFYFDVVGERYPIGRELHPESVLAQAMVVFNRRYPKDSADGGVARYRRQVASLWEADVLMIQEKLGPSTRVELMGHKCPECGFDWYEVVVNRDRTSKDRAKAWYDKDRLVALTVTYRPDGLGGLSRSFVHCGCCNETWVGDSGIRFVAYELEYPQLIEQVEHLAAKPIVQDSAPVDAEPRGRKRTRASQDGDER